jgi:hypothetical protein
MEHPFRVIGGAFAIADGENTSLLALRLAAAVQSNRFRVLLRRVILNSASLSAVTGAGVEVRLRRLSALEGGTAAVVDFADPRAPDNFGVPVSTLLTAVTGGTATASKVIGYRALNNDEVALSGQADRVPRVLWQACSREDRIVLHPGTGFELFQVTDSTVGAWIPELDCDLEWPG